MHELALARAILATALDRAEGRRVVSVQVSVGALRQVVPSSLAFNFEVLARGSGCDGATLEQTLEPARVRCECGAEWNLDELSFVCPSCDGGRTEVVCGQALRVESIEVEEEPCIAPR